MSDDEDMVPNPMKSAMDSLVTRTENAVSETPNMESPTGTIGDGPGWTGQEARKVHDDYLSPNSGPVKSALNSLVEDVTTKQGGLDDEVSRGTADAMRIDLETR